MNTKNTQCSLYPFYGLLDNGKVTFVFVGSINFIDIVGAVRRLRSFSFIVPFRCVKSNICDRLLANCRYTGGNSVGNFRKKETGLIKFVGTWN